MQSLGLALKSRGTTGEPLPNALESFDNTRIFFKRSQMSVIAAAPGGGKTALTIWMILRMMYEERGVPTLYICADTDMMTVASTALAGIMEIKLEEAELRIGQEDPEALELLEEWASHIWFCFRRGPTLDDIGVEMQAYAHVYGEYPHMIVIDTLKSIAEKGEELSKYGYIMPALSELAGQANAHVLVLHHVTGRYENGNEPIPRDGIKFKVSEEASTVLTLFRPDEGTLGVRVVKNRNGPAFTDASYGVDLYWEPSRGWFEG